MAKLIPVTELEENRTVEILPAVPSQSGVAERLSFTIKTSQHSENSGDSSHRKTSESSGTLQGSVRSLLSRSGWYDSRLAVCIRSVIRSRGFTTVGMVVLFVALFIPDLFVVSQVSTNIVLDIVLTFSLVIFAVEWIGLSGTDASYLFSFFFWMDMLGTVSILLDVSYFPLGPDATEPVTQRRAGNVGSSAIIVRAARAAKLGARAGRLSRVLKLLRFLPFLQFQNDKEEENVKVAKVISNQLTNMLSTRVSFLTICIALVLPVFSLFTYPSMDDSMSTWTRLLAKNAAVYCSTQDMTIRNATIGKLDRELTRFSKFYSKMSYGPFAVCCGKLLDDDDFQCNPTQLYRYLESPFASPDRKASITLVSDHDFQAFFDLSTPRQHEALGNIATICFIIIVMCSFSLLISSNMTVVVLNPLERMLAVVRGHCMQIFKYSQDLGGDNGEDEDDEQRFEDYDETENTNEFTILENVIVKLSTLAALFTKEEPGAGHDLDEDQIMTLNWMQGAAAVNARRQVSKRMSDLHRTSKGDLAVVESGSGDMNSTTCGCSMEHICALDTWFFDSQEFLSTGGAAMATYMILNHPRSSWTHAHVSDEKVARYVSVIESKYLENPFHNFTHALDVLYSLTRFMQLNKADAFVQEHAPFWMSIAAIAHDAGHLGVNNQFLIETSHELALKYNDRSPLENLHCATLFQVSKEPDADVFALLERDVYKDLRHCIIDAILHTDMTKHMELVKELNMLYEMNSDAFDIVLPDGNGLSDQANEVLMEPKHTQLVSNALLHAADINNPMKPWELACVLAYLCVDEFFAQGDLEKAAGIPVSMLNDREKVNKPNSQVGFIEFVIAPMVEPVCNLFPKLHPLAENLANNIQSWSKKWVEESNPAPEAVAKVEARVSKVYDKLLRLAKKTMGSEGQNRGSSATHA